MKKTVQKRSGVVKRFFSRMMWYFDRIFGNDKNIFWQILIIVIVIAVLVLFIGAGGALISKCNCKDISTVDTSTMPTWMQAVGLAFGASTLPPGDNQTFPLWWQTFAFLLGAVLFSGVTITFVGNWLSNRQEAYRKGTVRYCFFEDHVLFLGGSRIVLPMLNVVANDPELSEKDVVILTTDDVEVLRADINRILPIKTLEKLDISVLSGNHYDKETLESVYAGLAKKICIVGDHLSGSEHDSENVACWEETKSLCAGRVNVPCYLYFSRSSSVQLFLRRKDRAGDSLDTTVINYLESVAQSVFVHNGGENKDYPSLDRNGISPDSKRKVHLVVTGATAVSYAMAVTAAHLCHFPNVFDRKSHEIIPIRRTKITFIAPNIKEEMGLINSHLSSLFMLSHYKYIKDKIEEPHKPNGKYGDFLDIEWEFLDGSTTDAWVIERLKQYYKQNMEEETYLTMAFCEKEADRNIAAAVYLPSEFHKVYRLENGTVDYEKTIPLLVYQPNNEKMVKSAQKDAPLYGNLLPFGSMCESYDPSIRQCIEEGKRINYIYNKGQGYKSMTSCQEELDAEWREKTYLEQVSNIYCSNHIGMKLRSVGIGVEALQQGKKIPEDFVDIMAAVEHNRWNMEKLLVGFDPMEQSLRQELKQYDSMGDGKLPHSLKEETDKLKKEQYVHHCIAPYNELLNVNKECDGLIVRNLTDVLIDKNNNGKNDR